MSGLNFGGRKFTIMLHKWRKSVVESNSTTQRSFMDYDIDMAYEDRYSYPDPDEGNDEGMDSIHDEVSQEPCNNFEPYGNDSNACCRCFFDKAEHALDKEPAL
jgi:hypothetical protein